MADDISLRFNKTEKYLKKRSAGDYQRVRAVEQLTKVFRRVVADLFCPIGGNHTRTRQ